MRRLLKRVLIIIGVAAAVAYIAGIAVLFGKFQERTYVNDVDVSHMTAEEAEERYRTTWEGFRFTVKTLEGNEEIIDGDDIGYAIETKPSFSHMARWQNYLKWPLTPYLDTKLRPKEIPVFDEEALRSALTSLDCVSGSDVREPVNAHIGRTEEGYYELFEADDGNLLNDERTYEAVAEAIRAGSAGIDLEEAGCYEKATLYADDETLNSRFAPIDAFQQAVFDIDMAGGITEHLTKEIYGSWLDYDIETGSITVSEEKAREYTLSLYDKYSTFGHPRKFLAHAGDVVEVGGSNYDNFGYEMNVDATCAAIYSAVVSGASGPVSCTWERLGEARSELGSDFGNTYVEISLDEQRMWYYIEGDIIVSTSIVSGLATTTRATPTGCFQVLDKLTDHRMEGSYGAAFANYVIAIMHNGICIHDSSWRGEYGGDIWLYDGSHGCINTPYNAVKTMYENIWDGVPVVIYDRANTVPEVHNELYAPD